MTATTDLATGETSVFKVPTGMMRILDRDLKLARIPKRDERGLTLDVHALRHKGLPPSNCETCSAHNETTR